MLMLGMHSMSDMHDSELILSCVTSHDNATNIRTTQEAKVIFFKASAVNREKWASKA